MSNPLFSFAVQAGFLCLAALALLEAQALMRGLLHALCAPDVAFVRTIADGAVITEATACKLGARRRLQMGLFRWASCSPLLHQTLMDANGKQPCFRAQEPAVYSLLLAGVLTAFAGLPYAQALGLAALGGTVAFVSTQGRNALAFYADQMQEQEALDDLARKAITA